MKDAGGRVAAGSKEMEDRSVTLRPYDRERVRRLNEAIDEALLEPGRTDVAALRRLAEQSSAEELAERVRRRAARAGRRSRYIAAPRETLIAAIYAAAGPRGWFNAWCDGSSSRIARSGAGVGGFVLDPHGKTVARIAQFLPDCDPFAAEITAVVAVLNAALQAGATRIRAHTDCVALVRLWCEHRDDVRLEAIRELSLRFQRVVLRAIPRSHNQTAHTLARNAMAQWCTLEQERRDLRTRAPRDSTQ